MVTAESFEVGNDLANDLVTRALRGRFDLRVPVDGLPYGLQVDGVRVRPEGLAGRRAGRPTPCCRHRRLELQTGSGTGGTLDPCSPPSSLVKRRSVDFCRTGSCLCPSS